MVFTLLLIIQLKFLTIFSLWFYSSKIQLCICFWQTTHRSRSPSIMDTFYQLLACPLKTIIMFKTNLKCLVDGASETATPLAEYLSVYLGSILGLISISLTVFIYSLFSSSILLSSSYKQALVNLWISIVLFLGKNSMKA